MFKKLSNIIICGLIMIALILIAIGITQLINVNKDIETGVEEVENILDGEDNSNINSTVENEGDAQDGKAIGLLTFKLAKEYKTAVYDNITEEILKKGAGRATGTSKLNKQGNCVLYGHRDSAFRALWDIKVGDKLDLRTINSNKEYEVKNIYITNPDDVKIFDQSSDTKLTLVTCYPFIYSGPSDQRCVVECYAI